MQAKTQLMERLSTKSREELVALLQQLMQRQPNLEPLVETLVELSLSPTAPANNHPGKGRERKGAMR